MHTTCPTLAIAQECQECGVSEASGAIQHLTHSHSGCPKVTGRVAPEFAEALDVMGSKEFVYDLFRATPKQENPARSWPK